MGGTLTYKAFEDFFYYWPSFVSFHVGRFLLFGLRTGVSIHIRLWVRFPIVFDFYILIMLSKLYWGFIPILCFLLMTTMDIVIGVNFFFTLFAYCVSWFCSVLLPVALWLFLCIDSFSRLSCCWLFGSIVFLNCIRYLMFMFFDPIFELYTACISMYSIINLTCLFRRTENSFILLCAPTTCMSISWPYFVVSEYIWLKVFPEHTLLNVF